MNLRLIASTIVLTAAVVACGGGGGGGSPTPTTNTPTSTATPTQSPATTNASGTVVADDGNGSAGAGSPLAGVSVKLMPWAPCGPTPAPATSITPENDGCPTPLPSPQTKTASNGTFTLNGVPNGHYLLIIGADSTTTVGSVQATVHDNVTLTGGTQALKAPTLPTVPSGYTPASWETNGDYRLATLNATTEQPCLVDWQNERASNSVAASSVDEWLIENVRANNGYFSNGVAGELPSPVTTGIGSVSGGTDCSSMVSPQFATGRNHFATDPRTIWFAGQYLVYSANGGVNNEATGYSEFPIDPRSYVDPNYPNWP